MSMHSNVPVLIAIVRIAAVLVIVFSVVALWNFMLWLPWQLDCVIAAFASLAFAYTFERGDEC